MIEDSFKMHLYGGPEVSGQIQKSQHKYKSRNTNTKAATQIQKPQHKYKSHNTNTNVATQIQKPQHKYKSRNTNTNVATQIQKPQHKCKSHNGSERQRMLTKEKKSQRLSWTLYCPESAGTWVCRIANIRCRSLPLWVTSVVACGWRLFQSMQPTSYFVLFVFYFVKYYFTFCVCHFYVKLMWSSFFFFFFFFFTCQCLMAIFHGVWRESFK